MYRLVITRKDGSETKHQYDDYDTMEYNATLCQFSHNITRVLAQKDSFWGWTTLFTIGD